MNGRDWGLVLVYVAAFGAIVMGFVVVLVMSAGWR